MVRASVGVPEYALMMHGRVPSRPGTWEEARGAIASWGARQLVEPGKLKACEWLLSRFVCGVGVAALQAEKAMARR